MEGGPCLVDFGFFFFGCAFGDFLMLGEPFFGCIMAGVVAFVWRRTVGMVEEGGQQEWFAGVVVAVAALLV